MEVSLPKGTPLIGDKEKKKRKANLLKRGKRFQTGQMEGLKVLEPHRGKLWGRGSKKADGMCQANPSRRRTS